MDKKTCFVAIVGLPNAGKSSLINSIVEFPVSIVSFRAQTTRDSINAIYNKDNLQVVFVDTPGFHKRINNLSNAMNLALNSSLEGIDLVLFLQPVNEDFEENQQLLIEKISKITNKIAIITKVDLENSEEKIQKKISELKNLGFEKIFLYSTNSSEYREKLLEQIEKYAYVSNHFFSNEEVTDQSSRFFAKEIIRKQILLNLDDEIPHQCAVVIDDFDESDNRFVKIEATIYVGRKSHLPIVVGKAGAILGKIGTDSRKELEEVFGSKVVLKTHVAVAKK